MSLTLWYDFTQAPVATGVLEALNSKGPDLTVTRASTATFTDWEGTIRTVQANEPRITGARRVENLTLRSITMNAWTLDNITTSANTADTTDPDGGNTADKFTENTANSKHRLYRADTTTTAAPHTYSVYLKYSDRQWMYLRLTDSTSTNKFAYFDIQSGVVGTVDSGASAGITDAGNGWYRCWIHLTSAKDGTNTHVVGMSDSDGGETYVASSKVVYAWGAQVEQTSGQADPSPSEHVTTDGSATAYSWYDTYKPAPSSVTNLLTYSQDFSNAVWNLQSLTASADQVANPVDGTVDADLLYPASTGTYRRTLRDIDTETDDATSYTASVYVKGNGFDWLYFVGFDAASGDDNAWFNISTGVAGTVGSNILNNTIEDVGNGWFRVSWTATVNEPGTERFIIAPVDADNSVTATANGTDGIYVYGAQLETAHHGANSVPSTYIPTTTQAESSYRTNLCLQSQTFENASWTNLYTTDQADQASAPDGTMTADALFETAVTNYHRNKITVDCENSTTHVFSVYVKANGRSKVGLRESHITARYSTFDLDAETVIENGASSVGGIQSVGDGWYRVWVIQDSGATSFGPSIYILDSTYSSGSPTAHTYAGDVTKGLYIWGAQLEKSAAPVPSTYIATTTAAQSNNFASNSKDGAALDTAPTGLLIEEERTNLIRYSNELDEAVNWPSFQSTLSASTTLAPDGTTTAVDMVHTGASGYNLQSRTITAGTTYTVSFYIHAGDTGSHDWVYMQFCDAATSDGFEAWFDLTNSGAVGTSNALAAGTLVGTASEDVGNGWYRCSITGSTAAITAAQVVFINTTTDNSYTREQTNSSLVWGAQLEAGSFPTSYIGPTEGSSETRNGDVVKTTDVSWHNSTEGTLYCAASQPHEDTGQSNALVEISDDSVSDRWIMYSTTTSGEAWLYVTEDTTAGGTVSMGVSGAISDNTLFRSVSCLKANDSEFYIDGTRSGTGDQSITHPSNFSVFHVGSRYDDGLSFNGHIAEIRYWDRRLSDEALESISNGVFPSDMGFSRDLARTLARDLARQF